MRVQLNGGAPRDGRRTVQRERLNLKWFLRSFRLLKEYYHNVLNKIVVQAAAGRAGVCVQMYLGSEAHPAASIPFFLPVSAVNIEIELVRLVNAQGMDG